jgi:hypothetical protein
LLLNAGFVEDGGEGSHRVYRHPDAQHHRHAQAPAPAREAIASIAIPMGARWFSPITART